MVSESRALSEETPAYSAQVWVDGKHFCDTTNHGQGGPDLQHPPKGHGDRRMLDGALAGLNQRIAATFPAETYQAGGETHSFPVDLELLCHRLLEQRKVDKYIDRALKTKVMWIRGDKVLQIPIKGGHQSRERLVAYVRKREPEAKFLHDMPRDEVVKLLVR